MSYEQTDVLMESVSSIRFKITDQCQWECSFCHNEGNKETATVNWNPKLKQTFICLKDALRLSEVHITGGEPTTSKHCEAIINGLGSLGLSVKMTSNGQFAEEKLDSLIQSGLCAINFSVHSLSPEHFLRFQTGRGTLWQKNGNRTIDLSSQVRDSGLKPHSRSDKKEWAVRNIERQLQNIIMTRDKGINAKINTVISTDNDVDNAHEILNWAHKNNIPFRILNDLGNKDSVVSIYRFILDLDVKMVRRKLSNLTSSYSTIYRFEDGYEIATKQIRDFKLKSMCSLCPRNFNDTCNESFYGIRLQEYQGERYVLLCIQELNTKTVMTVEQFLLSPQFAEIKDKIYG